MSRFLETLLGWLLSAIAFFDSIRPRPGDDELTAEYRARQRACVGSTLFVALACVLVFIVTTTVESVSLLRAHLESSADTRENLGIVFAVVFGTAWIYAAYTYWSLWRFIKANRDD